MKKILLFILVFLPMLITARTIVPPGPVSGHWDIVGAPYVVTGDIFIEETASLVIDAGVEVLFHGWYKFEVFGSLTAHGQASNEVRFTSFNTILNWRGIRFMETTAASLLDHCIIERALADLDMYAVPDNCGGGIFCYKSPDASIIIRNSKILNNEARYGGGIMIWDSKPLIENCEIKYNEAWTGGGIYMYNHANAEIRKCKISLNNTETNGGGLMINNCPDIFLKCNQIDYNTAKTGAGLYLTYANGFMCGNTIAKNASSGDGGGIFFHIASNPILANCLIYYNTDGSKAGGNQVYIDDINCDPNFNHCNIESGIEGFEGFGSGNNFSGEYNLCIKGDPLFKNVAAGDFSITWDNYPYDDQTKSPCVDQGCPLQGLDPDNSCCDIGAYSYYQILDIPIDLKGELMGPNKFIASWEPSFGALGYLLDVSYNHSFTNLFLKDKLVEGTEYWVKLYEPAGLLFFRVRSFNTALTSEYSEEFMMIGMSADENDEEALRMYSTSNGLFIQTKESLSSSGEVWIYNTTGQLLGQHKLISGLNTIDLAASQQIVIVKAIVEGKVYQQKILLQ